MRSLFAALILWAAVVVPACAGPYEDANAALTRADFAAALAIYRGLAEKGEAEAQHNLGLMYDKGQGVRHDRNEAMKWIQRAAAQGYQDAILFLADPHDH